MARGINSKKARRRRENAFKEQGGLCWYCKRVMVIRVLQPHEKAAPDTCTLEHLRPRGHPDRKPSDFKTNVAACWECNQREAQVHGAVLQAKGWKQPGLISEPFLMAGKWFVEGEYHATEYPTELAAWEAARSYDAAVRERASSN